MAREDHIKQRLGRLHQGRHRLSEADEPPALADSADSADSAEPPAPPAPRASSAHPFTHLPNTSVIVHQGHPIISFDHHYDAAHLHGDQPLHRALVAQWLRLGVPSIPADAALYLDIETSGFGAEDTIFCVGLGRWLTGAQTFHVKQLIIYQPQAEAALLSLVWQLMLDPSVQRWVSFNGLGFDVPRLRARAQALGVTRAQEGVDAVDHLDLMKLVRSKSNRQRRYGLRIQEVTRLGLVRRDDVPGKEAPERWRRFVRTQESELLVGLIKHNALDVLSLVALVGVLGDQDVADAVLATPSPAVAAASIERDAPHTTTEPSQAPAQAPSRALERQQMAKHLGAQLGEQLGHDVHKKLERSYSLRSKSGPSSSRASSAPKVYGLNEDYATPDRQPQAPDPKVGQRVAALRARVEAQLQLGASVVECMGLLSELVALQPAHPLGLELLAEAYQALGLIQCAQSIRARQRSSSPY